MLETRRTQPHHPEEEVLPAIIDALKDRAKDGRVLAALQPDGVSWTLWWQEEEPE